MTLEEWREAVLKEAETAWNAYMRTQGALSLVNNMIAERDRKEEKTD